MGVPAAITHKLADVFSTRAEVVAAHTASDLSGEALPPFESGWIGSIAYGFGASLSQTGAAHGFGRSSVVWRFEPRWPQVVFHRLDSCLAFDHLQRRWWCCGSAAGRRGLQEVLLALRFLGREAESRERCYATGKIQLTTSREDYIAWVRAAIDYINAGDVYQVNLAHHLKQSFAGDALHWFAERLAKVMPRYATYISWDETGAGGQRRVIASLSPELYLEFEPRDRRLWTRPMKGTRPGNSGLREDLEASEKDRAELAMIVDLLRNDLGRVCQPGTMSVSTRREIELHGGAASGGVLQATATVEGVLEAGKNVYDAVLASFPGGSVTGAPKSRAMQIIDELEVCPREHYCGSSGVIADSGYMRLNINIRTAMISGAALPATRHHFAPGAILTYPVGAGIVAESEPGAEWEETLVKARPLEADGIGGV